MKIKILDKNDREIEFLLEDSNPQFANALRRIMITEIPILAINTIDFNINESVLYNEVIVHRMGLIPLSFDPKKFKFKEDGKQGSMYEVIFAINKKGAGTIYSRDMKSSNPQVKPIYDDIPIVELFGEQKLKLEASASLGMGKDNARYQSANVFYRYYPLAKLTGKVKNVEEIMKTCPKHAIKIEGNKVSVTRDCDMCQECVKQAEEKGILEITGDDTKFIFRVESISGLSAEDIVLTSVDILKKKAKSLQKEVTKIK